VLRVLSTRFGAFRVVDPTTEGLDFVATEASVGLRGVDRGDVGVFEVA
jgi:hypothetical protein